MGAPPLVRKANNVRSWTKIDDPLSRLTYLLKFGREASEHLRKLSRLALTPGRSELSCDRKSDGLVEATGDVDNG